MKEFNTNDLNNFINVDKLRVGGLETEYCLYAIRDIAQADTHQWGNSILDILDSVANIDFEKLNQANQATNKMLSNDAIIIDIIYEILDIVSTKQPNLIHRCQNINNKLVLANQWVEKEAISAKNSGSDLLKYFLKFRAKTDMTNAAQKLAKQIDR